MKGLVWKDFCLMRGLARSYGVICAIFVLLSIAGIYDGTFVATFLVMIGTMIPVNTFGYDEQARWDRYGAALPTGRKGIVRAKYVFTGLICLLCITIAMLIQLLLFCMGRVDAANLFEALLISAAPTGLGAMMNVILLPLLFKFGSQKGRIYLMLTLGVCVGGFVGGAMFLSKMELGSGIFFALTSVLPVLGFLALIPSYLLSLRIYEKKDL